MSTCSKCGSPLSTSLDEYGDFRNPICRDCFLAPENSDAAKRELEDLEQDIEDIETEIENHNDEIDDLKDSLSLAQKKLEILTSGARESAEVIKTRLKNWTNGNSKQVTS